MSTIATVLKYLGVTELGAMQVNALLSASQKLAQLQQECLAYRQKYRMSFADFQNKLTAAEQENFEEHDDFLAWKFAEEGVAYWSDILERLKQES